MGLKAFRSGTARRLIPTIGKPSSMARFMASLAQETW
jgi:hypothetical protein